MNAMKNLMHAVILAIWAVMGALFTLKCLFGTGPLVPSLFSAGSWWLWFAGFAALTTLVMRRFESAIAAPLVHGAAFVVLMMIPRVFPLSIFRLGIDLLGRVA